MLTNTEIEESLNNLVGPVNLLVKWDQKKRQIQMTDHHPCAQLFTCARYYLKEAEKDKFNTTHCVISLLFTAFSTEAFLNDHLLDLWENLKARKKLVGVSVKKWDEIERKGVMQKYDLLVDFFDAVLVTERNQVEQVFGARNMLAHPKVTRAAEIMEGVAPAEVPDPFKKNFTWATSNRHFGSMSRFMERLDKLAGRRIPTNRFVSGTRV